MNESMPYFKDPEIKSISKFFEEERIMRLVGNTYFLFIVKIRRTSNSGDIILINAYNLDNDDEYEINIFPTDIFGKLSKNFVELFFNDILNQGSSSQKCYQITETLINSRTKFMNSLLWLKLLISHNLKSDFGERQNIFLIDFDSISISNKFIKFDHAKFNKSADPAALLIGLSKNGRNPELGIQLPKIIKMTEEFVPIDYFKTYESLYKDRDIPINEKYDLIDKSEGLEETYEKIKIKDLERQCAELKKALAEFQNK